MPTMKSSGDLIASISLDMSDNNAGLISAEDVRHNMEDTALSINRIVCSGDIDVEFPFYNNVRARQVSTGDATAGIFIAESGVQFPNWPISVAGITNNTQIQPFPGIGGLDHGELESSSLDDDDHSAYYALNAARACTAHFKLGDFWLNASGHAAQGFKFVPVGPGNDQEIYTSGTLRFSDNSTFANAKGVAKAWINFDASGTANLPVIRGFHNISGVERLAPGKLRIVFSSGVFNHNNYVAVGTANATTSSGSKDDFSVNTVGLVMRDLVDNNPDLRSVTCSIKNENGDFVDSQIVDCVFYGYEPSEASGLPTPTTSIVATYADP